MNKKPKFLRALAVIRPNRALMLAAVVILGLALPHAISSQTHIGQRNAIARVRTAVMAAPFKGVDFSNYSEMTRRDVSVYFETRGKSADIIVQDGRYVSAGPLQYNAQPNGMLEGLLNQKDVRVAFGNDIDGFGGIRAIRRKDPAALDGLRVLLRDADFLSMYFAFGDRECEWLESEILRRYGLDVSGRGGLGAGIFRAFMNNRKNDVFKVVERMLSGRAADKIDSMTDAEFVAVAYRAMLDTLNETLKGHDKRAAIIRNYGNTMAHVAPHLDRPFITHDQKIAMTAAALEDHLRRVTGFVHIALIDVDAIIAKTVAENRDKIIIGADEENFAMMLDAFVRNMESIFVARGTSRADTAKIGAKGIDYDILPAVLPSTTGVSSRKYEIKEDKPVQGLLARAQEFRRKAGLDPAIVEPPQNDRAAWTRNRNTGEYWNDAYSKMGRGAKHVFVRPTGRRR